MSAESDAAIDEILEYLRFVSFERGWRLLAPIFAARKP